MTRIAEPNGEFVFHVGAASDWLYDRGYSGIGDDERDCLFDPERAEEARNMVDHWQARCGLPKHFADPILDHINAQEAASK